MREREEGREKMGEGRKGKTEEERGKKQFSESPKGNKIEKGEKENWMLLNLDFAQQSTLL